MKKYKLLVFVFFIFMPFFIFTMDSFPDFYKQYSFDNRNQEDYKKRDMLSGLQMRGPFDIGKIDPNMECQELPVTERLGVCFDFAMKEILAKHGMAHDFKIVGGQDWLTLLHCFKNSENPKKGDLVAYFSIDFQKQKNSEPVVYVNHYGLIAEPSSMRVKSKWGETKAIFTHDFFSVPVAYGDHAVVLRLKRPYRYPGVWQDEMMREIKKMEQREDVQKRLQEIESSLLKYSASFSPQASRNKNKIISLLGRYAALSVDCKDTLGGRTPLMLAATYENPAVVELLLQYGANPEESDFFGRTAVDIAAESDDLEIRKLLLRK